MTRVGIIGATGLAGEGVLEILIHHPHVELTQLTSDSSTGKKLSDVLKRFKGKCDLILIETNLDKLIEECDIIFLTKKDPASMELVSPLLKAGKKVIDLGGEFRLKDYLEYEKWYAHKHLAKDLLKEAVYGLPELNRNEIKDAKLIANPGCYPTGAILALTPLLKMGHISTSDISIAAYSGISGAGRTPANGNIFVNCNENIKAYGIGTHKHIPEIEQQISHYSGNESQVIFIPHLAPMNKGIFSTIFAKPTKETSTETLYECLKTFYANEEFILIQEKAEDVEISHIVNTNTCEIGVTLDKRTNQIIIVTAVDNLLKGASSQAVQNLNIMSGYPENTAITGKL